MQRRPSFLSIACTFTSAFCKVVFLRKSEVFVQPTQYQFFRQMEPSARKAVYHMFHSIFMGHHSFGSHVQTCRGCFSYFNLLTDYYSKLTNVVSYALSLVTKKRLLHSIFAK